MQQNTQIYVSLIIEKYLPGEFGIILEVNKLTEGRSPSPELYDKKGAPQGPDGITTKGR